MNDFPYLLVRAANLDRLQGSDLIDAMARDVQMFGRAFCRDKESEA